MEKGQEKRRRMRKQTWNKQGRKIGKRGPGRNKRRKGLKKNIFAQF